MSQGEAFADGIEILEPYALGGRPELGLEEGQKTNRGERVHQARTEEGIVVREIQIGLPQKLIGHESTKAISSLLGQAAHTRSIGETIQPGTNGIGRRQTSETTVAVTK